MTAEAKRADALQFIFSLFLGMLLVVFVGVGVWTFYEQPYDQDSPEQRELDRLYREQGAVMEKPGVSGTTTATAEQEAVQKKIDALNDKMREARDQWAVNTSIILLTFATLLMAISLFLPEHMKVFSNGVLLGGLFSVLYGTGWSFAGGDSRARFFVVAFALALSVFFGYLRFIRGRKEKAEAVSVAVAAGAGAGGAGVPVDSPALADLAARVGELERRAAAAAAALGAEKPRD